MSASMPGFERALALLVERRKRAAERIGPQRILRARDGPSAACSTRIGASGPRGQSLPMRPRLPDYREDAVLVLEAVAPLDGLTVAFDRSA